jgi:hypothetical protein
VGARQTDFHDIILASAQQGQGVTAHLNISLRAFRHFSRFVILSQPTNLDKSIVSFRFSKGFPNLLSFFL